MKLHLPVGLRVALLTAITSIAVYAKVAYTGTLISWDNLFSDAATASDNAAGLPANSVEFNFIEEPRSSLEDAQHPLSIANLAEIAEHTADRGNTYTAETANTTVNSQIPAAAVSGQLTSSPTPCSYSISASAPLLGSTGSAPGIAPVASAPANANVPSGYTEVTITSADQLGEYSSSDYIAFVIGADITDSAYRMTGKHQYWGDQTLQSHALAFDGLDSSGSGGAMTVDVLTAQFFKELFFLDNNATYGGAIDGGSSSTISLTGNESVTFSGNNASGYGGAIYGYYRSIISLTGNKAVTFSGNDAYYDGGAIYGYYSTISLTGNKAVTFSSNHASNGGAIYIYGGSSSAINLSNNGSLMFNGNTGGAIYGDWDSTISITDNGTVTFSENSCYWGDYRCSGSAIGGDTININNNGNVSFTNNRNTSDVAPTLYTDSGSISIKGNDHVVFRGNELSIVVSDFYSCATSPVIDISAGENQDIELYDMMYIKGDASFNSEYQDASGVVQRGEGDIVLSGKYLDEYKWNYADLVTVLGDHSTVSITVEKHTTQVTGVGTLYAGSLHIEDGAIYKGGGFVVAEGANATLALRDGSLVHAGADVSVSGGSTLDLQGANRITASNLYMAEGSALNVTLDSINTATSLLSLSGNWAQEGHLNINVEYDEEAAASSPLRILDTFKEGVPEGWNAENISLSGTTFDKLQWSEGILYLNLTGEDIPLLPTLDWAGGDMHWNSTSLNWLKADAPASFTDSSRARFGNTGSGDVELEGFLAPRSVLVDNSADHDYTFSGAGCLSGMMQLIKDGEGTLTINAANAYTGGTILNEGILVAGSSEAFGSGAIRINGGELDLGGYSIANAVSFAEGIDVTIRNGSLNTDFAVIGGSVDATEVYIGTQLLNVEGAGDVSFRNASIYGRSSSTISLTGNESVTFSGNGAYSDGGAIYGGSSGTIRLTDNGMVTFSGNDASSGGAIYGEESSAITIEGNDSVTFSWNDVYYNGGAIYGGSHSAISLTNNDSVTFSWNDASFGGAIHGYYSTISLTGNKAVTFSGNHASSCGGAIYDVGSYSTISLMGNGRVEFADNYTTYSTTSTSYGGGAIYGGSSGTIRLTDNGTVTFSGNRTAAYGGAIYGGSSSTISLMGNGRVEFAGNYSTYSTTSTSYGGGAIYGGSHSAISLTNNDSVTFSGNHTAAYGAAIYASGTLNLSDNESVEFRGNYEQKASGSSASYRLRSVYMTGGTLKLAAGENQNITFYDTLYAGSGTEVSFNADYTDKEGVTQKAAGDIVFSGKYAEQDLKELKANPTQQELTDSLTTEVYATTNLYGGRLRIEDGAIYKGYGINVASNSGATLRLNNGTLDQTEWFNITMGSGTTLDLQGVNNIAAAMLDMQDYSTLSFTLGETNLSNAVLTLDGAFNQGGNLTISILGDEAYNPGDKYRLVSMTSGVNPETWDIGKITLSGADTDVNHLKWENGVLYYNMAPLETAVWSGRQNREWNTTDANWTQGKYNYRYKDGVDVVFGDTGSGEVELVGELAPKSVQVENSAGHDYAFSGEGHLAGEMQLTKEGEGKLTISTANDYAGGTVINGGTMVVNNATALGTGDVALNGAELHIAADATISGQITVNGENLLTVADGCALSLGSIIINNAYVEMQGTFDISRLSAEVLESGYTGGTVQGNGFAYSTLQVQVVENAYGAYTEMSNGTFLYNGVAGVAGDDGEVVLSTVDGSVFHVNTGTESLAAAFRDYTPAGIFMADGTGLNLDVSGATVPVIELETGAAAATLNVQQDATLGTITSGGQDTLLTINGTAGKVLSLTGASDYEGSVLLAGGTVSVNQATALGAGDVALNGVELHIAADATISGQITIEGENLLVVADGHTLTLGQRIANNAFVDMQGTFDISGLSSEILGTDYTGGAVRGNGFVREQRLVQVVENAYGAYAEMAGGTFLYDGFAGEAGYDGDVTVYTVIGSAFYVNEGTESLSKAYEQYEPTRFMMADGTTLNLNVADAQIDELGVIESGRVILNVTEDTKMASLTGGGGESNVCINATGKTVTMGDSAGYTGNFTLNGGTLVAESNRAFAFESIQINDGTLDMGGYSFACDVSAENAAVAIRNGRLGAMVNITGGSLDADELSIRTQNLIVKDASEVSFCDASSNSNGGAIYAQDSSTIDVSNNQSVTFAGNRASTYSYHPDGGAIYGGYHSNINLSNNGSVTFRENQAIAATADSYSYGGAVFSDMSSLNISGNDAVTFSKNSADYGGALCGPINLTDNGNVTFSENSAAIGGGAVMRSLYLNGNECVVFNKNTAEAANSSGGAIRAYDSIVSVTGNGSVTFSGNSAEYGGAIYSSYVSAVDMADNDSIAFIGNSGTHGAAIYGTESSSISLVGNKNVEFRGNVSSDSYAGAIYIEDGGSLNLIGNDHVEFRGNYLKYAGGEEYVVLQGIYVDNPYGSYYNCNLNLAAGENQDIVFYDPLYVAEGTNVSFNASFEDKDGVMQAATGDIVFSGVHAEEDVREIFDKGTEYLPWHSPTYIPWHSQTSAVYTTTHLYGGRLCIEDGAIYAGKGINVAAGSAATLRLADGTLEQAGYNVTLNAGTTLDLAGVNSVRAAALYMLDGSTLSFTLGAPDSSTAILSMNGSFVQEGALTISLAAENDLNKGDEFLLMTLSDIPASWDESNITVNGLDAGLDNLSWVNGKLYFMYGDVAPLQTATWSGAQSRTWNITERNWTQGEYSYRYKDGVDVVFGDTGSGEVELEGELAPQSVLVENSAGHDYAFTGEGKLTGGMQLTKDGEGKLTISNSNTYTGGTVINGGTLRIENGAALGTNTVNLNGGTLEVAANGLTNAISAAGTSAITVENGNTLALQSAIENLGTLTLKGAFDASALTLTQEASTHVDVDGNVGDSGFTRTGAGSVIVVNGGITVDGGATISHSDLTSGEILVLGADGRATANGVVDYRAYLLTGEDTASVAAIKGKAGDQLQAINVEGGTLTIDTSTDVLNATGGTVNITENVAVDGSAEDTAITAAAGTLNAVLSGTTSITVTGDVTVNGSNTHSGITTVQAGTLHVGNGNALGTGTVSLSDATLEIAANGFANDISSTGTNGITIADGYTLALQNAIETVGTLTLQGAFDASALDLVHGKATRVNTEGVSGNSGFAKEGDYSVTIVNGGVSIDGGATITHNEVASLTFVLSTDGTATSEGAVDYTSYLLTGEDTASVAAINEKAGENLESIDVVGGVLTVDAATDVLNAAGGAVNITENVAVDGVLQDTAIVATAGTINAVLSGTTSITVTGDATVNGENSHNGGTTIQGGTLHLGSEGALGEGLVTLNGGTLDAAGMSIDNHVVVTGDSSIGSGALEGSLTINGAVLHALGNIAIEGQLATEGQSGIVAEDGALVTLFQTIHNTGELALSGEFDLSLLDCKDQGIHYMIGPTEGNGFATEVHSITVVDAGTCDLDAGTFRYRGETAAFAKEGVAYLTDTNYSRFYVFSGTESLSTALDTAAASGETMEGITMSDGARLRVDRDMDADFVTVTSGTATLDIAAGATVSEGDGNRAEFNLTGSGIYSLAAGNMELGAMLDSEGWCGTVALNHVADEAIRTMNLNDYGHEGSIVRLNGVQGHFIAGNTVFNPTLELVGDGLEIVSCQSGRIYEFAGGVKGDGNLTYNLTSGYAHNQTYVFSGDVSEWTGAYESLVDKKTSTLKFIGDATEMGAAIRQTAGTVNVEVGNGTDEHTTAFKNEMEAGTFTVKEHATAVLENTATITNSLSLQGTLEIKGGSVALAQNAEVVVGDAYTITGKGADVTALSGTLSMDEQGLYGTGDKAARIDHSIIKLAENSRVEVSNVILGASSKLLDDPATVVANGMVIEAEMGVNVEAGDVLTLAKGSVMTRLGNASESVTLDKDSFACTFDITNVQDVRLTGDCLTIDISSMYPELKVLSAQYEWLGISLGDGDHAATVDENLMVEFILSDRLRARGYYLSSVGWGGTAVTIPEPGENVGMIYIPLYEVPEPATSTLSLLALAALAYRRRKK